MGSCHVEGDPPDEWRDCGVFDFSALGLGLDLRRRPGAPDPVGGELSVCLPVGASMEVTLTGVVRNAKAGPDGILRAGVEFESLSETEHAVIEMLEAGSILHKL